MCKSDCKCVGKCVVCKCQQTQEPSGFRQEISWKQARAALKLGNPAEYYRSFREVERRLCRGGLKHSSKDSFVKVEIFSPQKEVMINLKGGALLEFQDDNVAIFYGGYYG